MQRYSKILVILVILISGCSTNYKKVSIEKKETVTITPTPNVTLAPENIDNLRYTITDDSIIFNDYIYNIIEVNGGDLSGYRESNVAVDIGYNDRVYWALTNDYGQLVYVFADVITLQDDSTEDVNKDGRYYDEEANVPGTEKRDLDQGHVIADSLGGVANAYNITPQNSIINRHGDQAYMEKNIRDANGCTDFFAEIIYPDTETQIPYSYRYTYTLMGNDIVDEFINDDDNTNEIESSEINKIDTNGNGNVSIREAKKAGYHMPICSNHWLYKYMHDENNDGCVGP